MIPENYLYDYQGIAEAGQIEVPADTVIRLPDKRCKFVMISNWTTEQDAAFTPKTGSTGARPSDAADGLQIYYGFGGRIMAQLFAGENSELLPVNNLNQIVVQLEPATAGRVWYAYFY